MFMGDNSAPDGGDNSAPDGEINPNTNQTCTTNFDSQCTTSCFSLQRHDTTMQFSEYVIIKHVVHNLKISFKNNTFYLVMYKIKDDSYYLAKTCFTLKSLMPACPICNICNSKQATLRTIRS
uniref:Uncharacterized protein n=1 Tax=Cacopsylla melanoneura TaxID=428564 RepID=A0A8D9F7B2_9HEMI